MRSNDSWVAVVCGFIGGILGGVFAVSQKITPDSFSFVEQNDQSYDVNLESMVGELGRAVNKAKELTD